MNEFRVVRSSGEPAGGQASNQTEAEARRLLAECNDTSRVIGFPQHRPYRLQVTEPAWVDVPVARTFTVTCGVGDDITLHSAVNAVSRQAAVNKVHEAISLTFNAEPASLYYRIVGDTNVFVGGAA